MKVVKWLVGGIVALILLALLWGTLIEPYLVDVEYETALIHNLPAGWEGQQVGVISDFQLGMWGDNEEAVRKAVNRLIELRPAAVFILGDFIYHAPVDDESEIETSVELLLPLVETEIPVYGVLGNHDYQVNEVGEKPNLELSQRLAQELELIGVQILQNEAVELSSPQANEPSLFLVGIGPHQPGLDDIEQAFSGLPQEAPRFVVMHNPASFASIPAGAAPTAAAGHTHGGQIRLPFAPEWTMLTFVRSEPVHADGWIDNYGQENNRLYVNRGIGFSIVPIRINCMPEVTIFTLQPSL